MKLLFKVLLVSVFFDLSCQPEKADGAHNQVWSVSIADFVIKQHPSLVYYNRKPGKEKLQYDVALVGMAIDKLGSVDEKYSLYLQDYVNFFIDSTGTIKKFDPEEYNLDHINFAKNLITLYKRTGDQRYLTAIQTFRDQLDKHPRTSSGGYWHKKIYPEQIWLDGSYMALPFIAQYAKEFNHTAWFDLAAGQLVNMYNSNIDKETGLLYHAIDESKSEQWCNPETGLSGIFWGRAIGWYMMALVDVLDYLPENHPQYQNLIDILNNISGAVLKYRHKDEGVWYQVLDKADSTGNYPEASASAMFIYSYAKGANHGYLPKSYLKVADDAFDDLVAAMVREDDQGNITIMNICGGCGLGGKPYRDGSYNYYVTEKRVINDPKGVASLILAAIEMKK